MISIITPVYNEESSINELCERIIKTVKNANQSFEIIFVDNGSEDNSLSLIKNLAEKYENVKYLSLTKNVGHQSGIWAGISFTNNTVIIIDADLQQPPEIIDKFITKWQEGFKIVKTKKIFDEDPRWWKKFFSTIFYKLINKLTNLNLFEGQSDFCLIDSVVVKEIKKFKEKKTFLRGMLNLTGFKSCHVEYIVTKRKSGDSKFLKRHYINFALDGIFNYSKAPISFLFWLGASISLLCVLYIFYLLAIYFFYPNELFPAGWITISILLMFFGSLNLIAITILGRYILLVLEDNKNRPEYFVKEKNF